MGYRLLSAGYRPKARLLQGRRHFSCTPWFRADLEAELTAPNGQRWTQPLGLFANNEFVRSEAEGKLATVNP
jgi:aldehyde dehydrogenase (NAD(P)+)